MINDIQKQQHVKKEFKALESEIGKEVIITYASKSGPSEKTKGILLQVIRHHGIEFKKKNEKMISFFIGEERGISKIEKKDGTILYQNDTINFFLDEDGEKNRNLLKEAKYGTNTYNTNYNKFKTV